MCAGEERRPDRWPDACPTLPPPVAATRCPGMAACLLLSRYLGGLEPECGNGQGCQPPPAHSAPLDDATSSFHAPGCDMELTRDVGYLTRKSGYFTRKLGRFARDPHA